jgi:hypothetical protein
VHMGSRMPSHLPSPLIVGEEKQERKIQSWTGEGEVSGSGQCLPSCSVSGSLPHRPPWTLIPGYCWWRCFCCCRYSPFYVLNVYTLVLSYFACGYIVWNAKKKKDVSKWFLLSIHSVVMFVFSTLATVQAETYLFLRQKRTSKFIFLLRLSCFLRKRKFWSQNLYSAWEHNRWLIVV